MKLGFIGTGAITSAIVTGLSSPPDAGDPILVSPRNPQIAADLAARFPGVSVAASNQAVLDWCDTVLIAVRPQIARGVLAELTFHPRHHVVSLVSGLSVRQLSALVAPSVRITRAVPLPSTANRQGSTAVFPGDRNVLDLFAKLGAAFATTSEGEFEALCAATATIASYLAFAGTIASWLERHGVQPAQARDYLARMFGGLNIAAPSGGHATRGGTNEQLLAHLNDCGVFTSLSDGLDAILRRIAP
ncbi:MAG TPA: NAD(P)-binding domain-containing protein [Bryobacteraceae bacterium]|nr:NAD(P)-binding domain-containing protein [Bryobacteraceae bacterium]